MHSRQSLHWCRNHRDCMSVHTLCDTMENDHHSIIRLQHKFPKKLKYVESHLEDNLVCNSPIKFLKSCVDLSVLVILYVSSICLIFAQKSRLMKSLHS